MYSVTPSGFLPIIDPSIAWSYVQDRSRMPVQQQKYTPDRIIVISTAKVLRRLKKSKKQYTAPSQTLHIFGFIFGGTFEYFLQTPKLTHRNRQKCLFLMSFSSKCVHILHNSIVVSRIVKISSLIDTYPANVPDPFFIKMTGAQRRQRALVLSTAFDSTRCYVAST